MASGGDLRGKSLLTNREREVFELLVQDKTTKEIAAQLFVSEKTVRNHISNVMCSLVMSPPLVFPLYFPFAARTPRVCAVERPSSFLSPR